MAETRISDAEWQVMQVVWDRGTATAAEVIADLKPASKWRHRTIRTLLSRLVEKGALTAQADGNRNIYRPLVTRSKCIREESQSFLQRVFSGDAGELLVHFVRSVDISPTQMEELKRLLDEKRRGR